jgi:type II secretory pathway component PulL
MTSFWNRYNKNLLEVCTYEKRKKEFIVKNKVEKVILRNDPAKKRKQEKELQQLNFSIDRDLHLDIKDLHIMEQRKRGEKLNLKDFFGEILAKGVKEWLNR